MLEEEIIMQKIEDDYNNGRKDGLYFYEKGLKILKNKFILCNIDLNSIENLKVTNDFRLSDFHELYCQKLIDTASSFIKLSFELGYHSLSNYSFIEFQFVSAKVSTNGGLNLNDSSINDSSINNPDINYQTNKNAYSQIDYYESKDLFSLKKSFFTPENISFSENGIKSNQQKEIEKSKILDVEKQLLDSEDLFYLFEFNKFSLNAYIMSMKLRSKIFNMFFINGEDINHKEEKNSKNFIENDHDFLFIDKTNEKNSDINATVGAEINSNHQNKAINSNIFSEKNTILNKSTQLNLESIPQLVSYFFDLQTCKFLINFFSDLNNYKNSSPRYNSSHLDQKIHTCSKQDERNRDIDKKREVYFKNKKQNIDLNLSQFQCINIDYILEDKLNLVNSTNISLLYSVGDIDIQLLNLLKVISQIENSLGSKFVKEILNYFLRHSNGLTNIFDCLKKKNLVDDSDLQKFYLATCIREMLNLINKNLSKTFMDEILLCITSLDEEVFNNNQFLFLIVLSEYFDEQVRLTMVKKIVNFFQKVTVQEMFSKQVWKYICLFNLLLYNESCFCKSKNEVINQLWLNINYQMMHKIEDMVEHLGENSTITLTDAIKLDYNNPEMTLFKIHVVQLMSNYFALLQSPWDLQMDGWDRISFWTLNWLHHIRYLSQNILEKNNIPVENLNLDEKNNDVKLKELNYRVCILFSSQVYKFLGNFINLLENFCCDNSGVDNTNSDNQICGENKIDDLTISQDESLSNKEEFKVLKSNDPILESKNYSFAPLFQDDSGKNLLKIDDFSSTPDVEMNKIYIVKLWTEVLQNNLFEIICPLYVQFLNSFCYDEDYDINENSYALKSTLIDNFCGVMVQIKLTNFKFFWVSNKGSDDQIVIDKSENSDSISKFQYLHFYELFSKGLSSSYVCIQILSHYVLEVLDLGYKKWINLKDDLGLIQMKSHSSSTNDFTIENLEKLDKSDQNIKPESDENTFIQNINFSELDLATQKCFNKSLYHSLIDSIKLLKNFIDSDSSAHGLLIEEKNNIYLHSEYNKTIVKYLLSLNLVLKQTKLLDFLTKKQICAWFQELEVSKIFENLLFLPYQSDKNIIKKKPLDETLKILNERKYNSILNSRNDSFLCFSEHFYDIKRESYNPLCWKNTKIEIMSMTLKEFAHLCEIVPSFVRQWFKELNTKLAANVKDLVMRYISKNIIESLLAEIGSEAFLNICPNITVKIINVGAKNLRSKSLKKLQEADSNTSIASSKQLQIGYLLDETTIDLELTVPCDWPLEPIDVKMHHNKINWVKNKSHSWTLELNKLLNYQNGSLLNAIKLWSDCLDSKLDNTFCCPICFAVVLTHGGVKHLPKKECRTCKKKFHQHCLYTWFETSLNPVCPLCRMTF